MVNGCSKNGKGINTHNAIVDTLKEMASYAGLKTKREQKDCFLVGSVKETNRRSDLTISGIPGPIRQVILDVSNICAVPIFGITANRRYTRQMAITPQYQANIRYAEKMLKYDAIASSNGLKFHPIIFETTGRIHSSSLDFIRSILKNVMHLHDKHALYNYWLSRISCSYQHQIAISILDKLRKCKGDHYAFCHHENKYGYIDEFNSGSSLMSFLCT